MEPGTPCLMCGDPAVADHDIRGWELCASDTCRKAVRSCLAFHSNQQVVFWMNYRRRQLHKSRGHWKEWIASGGRALPYDLKAAPRI